MENVFLLPGFQPSPTGSQQRVLGREFNHFIKQLEAKGARVVFVADTCHGGGMVREIDPRSEEMSFRQVPSYRLTADLLTPVTTNSDGALTELDFDRTDFLAAVDRRTKAPEVSIPGVQGLRGALSYSIARAIEGTRFPPGKDRECDEEASIVRAADLIGQLGDPHYLRKANALYHEFEEVGMNRQLGYESPADIVNRYPQFYWNCVAPHIQTEIRYLNMTSSGRQWIASLYGNLFRAEREISLSGPQN
jgi:hypothetical protein